MFTKTVFMGLHLYTEWQLWFSSPSLLWFELPAELLYNYAVSDISKAIENDNAEAATKT